MKLPGLTAEASLYETSGHYHMNGPCKYAEADIYPAIHWTLEPPVSIRKCRLVPNYVCTPPTEPGQFCGEYYWDGTYRWDCTPPPR
jgi:hypothetical protein